MPKSRKGKEVKETLRKSRRAGVIFVRRSPEGDSSVLDGMRRGLHHSRTDGTSATRSRSKPFPNPTARIRPWPASQPQSFWHRLPAPSSPPCSTFLPLPYLWSSARSRADSQRRQLRGTSKVNRASLRRLEAHGSGRRQPSFASPKHFGPVWHQPLQWA